MGNKMTTNTSCRLCVLCKNWNGAIGSITIKPLMGKAYQYDHDEKQSCFLKRIETPSWSTCPKFELRYK